MEEVKLPKFKSWGYLFIGLEDRKPDSTYRFQEQ